MYLKSSVYKTYFLYKKKFPIQKGKSFLGRLLFKCFGNAIFSFDNIKFELNPLSLIDSMMIEDGSYEQDIFTEIKKHLLKEGGIFLDIGANFGLFAIQAAKLDNVYVFAFEPSKRELRRLYKNTILNRLTNITVFPFGLSEKNYTAQLNISDNSNQSMNSLINSFPDSKTEKIECFALDNVLAAGIIERVKIIKIDIEGFEYNALLGMQKLLTCYNGPLILEITYYLENKDVKNYNPDNIYDFLHSKGYNPKYGKRYATQYNDFFYKHTQ